MRIAALTSFILLVCTLQTMAQRTQYVQDALLESGFNVTQGRLVPLTRGTCSQCLGSPSMLSQHPHVAVALPFVGEGAAPCPYMGSQDSTCFGVAVTEVILAIVDGPITGLFEEFSWGAYVFDVLGANGERIITQASVDFPTRPTRGNRMAVLFGWLPEMLDAITDILIDSGFHENDVHIFPVHDGIGSSSIADMLPRMNVLLKHIPKSPIGGASVVAINSIIDDAFVCKISLGDEDDIAAFHTPILYSKTGSKRPARVYNGDRQTERQSLFANFQAVVNRLKNEHNVVGQSKSISIRDFMGVQNAAECVQRKTNCLSEDWDVSYSVSGGFYLPDPAGYMFAVVGVDHPEGRLTTLSLMDAVKNQELAAVTDLESDDDMVYVQWFARDCSAAPGPCKQIGKLDVPSAIPVFLRERAFGLYSHDTLVMPTVLWVDDTRLDTSL